MQAENVTVTFSTDNEYINITDGVETYGNMAANSAATIVDAFAFNVSNDIPDNQNVVFNIEATDGTAVWTSQLIIKSYAPILNFIDFSVSDATGNNNGKIEPGETGEITITVANNGSSDALNVMGDLICSGDYVVVNTSAQSYGTLAANDVVQKTYTVTADASTPEGYQAMFDFNIEADLGVTGFGNFYIVIGRFTALIIDLDTKNYSGPGIYETFNDMGIFTEYTTAFPEDLDLYKNVFVCLGIHFSGHVLTQSEGTLLKNYLLNGGNLYMEGRVTWSEDPVTPVHPLFNINSEDVAWFQYEFIDGIPGTFTNGVSFEYNGQNAIGQYALAPIENAFNLFQTSELSNICGIANNAVDYKTIGTSFEFGQMLDGESPSTKAELMQLILNWFDGITTDVDLQNNTGRSNLITSYPNPFRTETTIRINTHIDSDITLKIVNSQGQLVKILIDNENISSGKADVTWDSKNRYGNTVPAGLYFGVLKSNTETEIIKLIVK